MSKEVAVNNIIGLNYIKQQGIIIQLGTNILISPDLELCFNKLYESTTAGLSSGITFTSEC